MICMDCCECLIFFILRSICLLLVNFCEWICMNFKSITRRSSRYRILFFRACVVSRSKFLNYLFFCIVWIWFIVIWSLKIFWWSFMLIVVWSLLILVVRVLLRIFWLVTRSRAYIGRSKLLLELSIYKRLMFGCLDVFLLNFIVDVCCLEIVLCFCCWYVWWVLEGFSILNFSLEVRRVISILLSKDFCMKLRKWVGLWVFYD